MHSGSGAAEDAKMPPRNGAGQCSTGSVGATLRDTPRVPPDTAAGRDGGAVYVFSVSSCFFNTPVMVSELPMPGARCR